MTRRCGFTLLEIMVAMSIMSIALVALLTANNRALALSGEANRLSAAVSLARMEIERIALRPALKPGLSEREKRKDIPEFNWRSEIKATPFTGLVEVSVSVFEADDKNEESLFTLKGYFEK